MTYFGFSCSVALGVAACLLGWVPQFGARWWSVSAVGCCFVAVFLSGCRLLAVGGGIN